MVGGCVGMPWLALITSPLLLLLLLTPAKALRHDSLTVTIPPRQQLCVHEDFTQAQRKVLDLFVEKGGAIDIDVKIYGPLSDETVAAGVYTSPVFQETISTANIKPDMMQAYEHEFIALHAGTYAFCLDNARSKLLSKLVQIDLIDPTTSNEEEEEQSYIADDLKSSLYNIKKGLGKVQAQQKRDRHRLTLHSEANKSSHNRMVFGSIIETIVFVGASAFQIFFVRRWFQGRRNLKPWA